MARDLPSPPTLINWFTAFMGSQHAFAGVFRSLCERVRYSARLEIDRTAPLCPDCVSLARAAVGRVLDYIVDSEAAAAWAHLDLQNRMTEPELVHAKGGLPDPDSI